MTQPIPPPDYVPPPIELEPKYVVFQAIVPGRLLAMPDQAGMASHRATYFVSLLDWSCEGEVNGLVLANPDWWKEHCAEVGQQVRAKLRDLVGAP
jgi:hypothetical protein